MVEFMAALFVAQNMAFIVVVMNENNLTENC